MRAILVVWLAVLALGALAATSPPARADDIREGASVRLGKVAGEGAVDFIIRWSVLKAHISPFVAAGYAYLGGGAGFTLAGGLRYDAVRNERVAVSVLAELGLRTHAAMASDPGDAPGTGGVFFPILASLQDSDR